MISLTIYDTLIIIFFFNLCFEFIIEWEKNSLDDADLSPPTWLFTTFLHSGHKRIKMLSSGFFSPCVLCDWTTLQKICLTSIDSARHTQEINDYPGDEKNAYVIAHFRWFYRYFVSIFHVLNTSLKFPSSAIKTCFKTSSKRQNWMLLERTPQKVHLSFESPSLYRRASTAV